MMLPDGSIIKHAGKPYDPQKAHEYYLRTRKLKGRKSGSKESLTQAPPGQAVAKPSPGALAKAKIQLAARIDFLKSQLKKLEEMIAKEEREAESEAQKSEAKKERAAKEAAMPDTAAEKAEKARESKKYREKHEQEIKTKAESAGGGSSKGTPAEEVKKADSDKRIADLKTLATKVKGQLAVAESKLRAL